MPKIVVDGRELECRDKVPVLTACLEAGIDVPHYCYHPGLSAPASCRICLVEVEGMPKLVPACYTPVRDGMALSVSNSKVVANQKQVMEYLLLSHPLDCPVCDKAGECSLQDYSYNYGRSGSRFEEEKLKNPKKDVGEHVLLYTDRCILCTRCVRFTREVSGTSELMVDGRGHKEEIDIFPGKPLDNRLSLNVVDLCPVGALLDKSFLFQQRVWLLKRTPSISPVDAGGENIWIDQNEDAVYRVKPRHNAAVNGHWISNDTRHSYKALGRPDRLTRARTKLHGAPHEVRFGDAVTAANLGLREVHRQHGNGSLAAVLSPMLACEEAFLLATFVRGVDPEATLVVGPAPRADDEAFQHYVSRAETFRIQGEKVPNRRGVERVIELLGGPRATWDELAAHGIAEVRRVKGAWVTGNYLDDPLPIGWEVPESLRDAFLVAQDCLPNKLTERADVVLPSAMWAETEGSWENHAGVIQAFAQATKAPGAAQRAGDVYVRLLTGQRICYTAAHVREQMGAAFADVKVPEVPEEKAAPAVAFAEL